MQKLLLAVHRNIEQYLESAFNATGRYEVVGLSHYRESIIEKAKELQPNIIVFQDAVRGNIDVDETIFQIKTISPSIRIVYISAEEDRNLLSQLVLYGVYDFLIGTSLALDSIQELLDNPKTIQDVVGYTRNSKVKEQSLKIADQILCNTEEEVEEAAPESGSFISGIFGKKKKNKTEAAPWTEPPKTEVSYEPEERHVKEEPEIKISETSNQKEESPAFPKASEEKLSTDEKYEIIKKAVESGEETLNGEDEQLFARAEEYASSCRALIEKTQTFKEKINELRDEKERLHVKMTEAKDDCYDLEKEVELLQRQIDERQEDVLVNPEKRIELEQKIEKLTFDLEEIEENSDFLEDKIEYLVASKRLYTFIDKNIPDDLDPTMYEKLFTEWKAESKNVNIDISSLREEIVKADQTLSKLETEKLNTNNELLYKKIILRKSEEEKEKLMGELLDTEDTTEKLSKELDELKNKKSSLQKKIEELNDSLNQEIKTISDFENVLNLPGSTKAKDAIRSLNEEIMTLKAENSRIKKENVSAADTKSKEELDKSREIIERLNKSISEKDAEINARPTKEAYSALVEERNTLKDDIFTLKSQIDNLSESSKMAQEAERSMRENEELKDENKELKSRIQSLKTETEELKNRKDISEEENRVETTVIIDGNEYRDNVIRPKKTFLPASKYSLYTPPAPTSRKIIAFVGAKNGIGNTYTALNVAALLAKTAKVLYVEFDEVNPLTSYLFAFENLGIKGNIINGIDKSMATTKTGKYQSINEAIVKPKNAPIPKSLHFLTYSQEHLLGYNGINVLSGFDELFRRIKIEGDYEYIIADFPAAQNVATGELLSCKIYVDAIYMTITQDVHTIACADKKIDNIKKISERMARDINYVLLDYNEKCKINVDGISNWLYTAKERIFPLTLNKAFINECICDGQVYSMIGDGCQPFKKITENIAGK